MSQQLPLQRLGKSDLMISPIGLGCWQFSRGKGFGGNYWPVLKENEIANIVQTSLEGGINWFDTAESYGWGESEKALSRALKALGKSPGDVIIATKWSPLLRTAKSIAETIDRRLESLGGFPIDLYQIHNPFSFSPIKKQIKAMAELFKKQKIRNIGVSNFSAKRMRLAQDLLKAEGIPLISNQVRYNLLNRRIEKSGILEAAKELGISIIAYSPLAQGLLSGKFHDDPKLIKSRTGYRKHMRAFKQTGLERSKPVIMALREIAQKRNVKPSQVALNWVINSQGETVVAIPGATSTAQAKDNAGSMIFRLTSDEVNYLNSVSSSFTE